eukprot:TRINITY_DN61050_c0_g1_i1.p1 TRINITY_DN61050_c0_g1~~TRINITY_DN61050_c0_g1_i1.p1  ORF type:complete len:437 (+),score=145.84 TRINITY_DN61050_c0_g1_i1:92-1402(+)
MSKADCWTVDDVCALLRQEGIDEGVLAAFRRNKVDGRTLSGLEKRDLKEELDIAALQDRKRAWEAVCRIKSGTATSTPTSAPGTTEYMTATSTPTSAARSSADSMPTAAAPSPVAPRPGPLPAHRSPRAAAVAAAAPPPPVCIDSTPATVPQQPLPPLTPTGGSPRRAPTPPRPVRQRSSSPAAAAAPAAELPRFSVGMTVIYSSKTDGDRRAKVIAIDRAVSPPAYTVQLLDGRERSVEGSQLGPLQRRFSDDASGTPQSGRSPKQGSSPAGTPRRSSLASAGGTGVQAVHALRDSSSGARLSPVFRSLQAEREAYEALEKDIIAAKEEARTVQIQSPIEPSTRSSHNDAKVQAHIITPKSAAVTAQRSRSPADGPSVTEDTILGDACRSYNERTRVVESKVDYKAIQEEQLREEERNARKYQQYENFMKAASFK